MTLFAAVTAVGGTAYIRRDQIAAVSPPMGASGQQVRFVTLIAEQGPGIEVFDTPENLLALGVIDKTPPIT